MAELGRQFTPTGTMGASLGGIAFGDSFKAGRVTFGESFSKLSASSSMSTPCLPPVSVPTESWMSGSVGGPVPSAVAALPTALVVVDPGWSLTIGRTHRRMAEAIVAGGTGKGFTRFAPLDDIITRTLTRTTLHASVTFGDVRRCQLVGCCPLESACDFTCHWNSSSL